MSIVNEQVEQVLSAQQFERKAESHVECSGAPLHIQHVLEDVQAKITPVWPLRDYVAVNPYAGLTDQKFLAARKKLRLVSDVETLMPVDYYRKQFAEGSLRKDHLDAAVDELVADGVTGAERIDINQVLALLKEPSDPSPTADAEFTPAANPNRPLRTFAEIIDRHTDSVWTRRIQEEISKYCSTHYDEGQAAWSSPWNDLPLYQAWRTSAQHDRSFEVHGASGFRRLVSSLPHDPYAALDTLLNRFEVPRELWSDFLHCEALAMPGWSAWSKYQHRQAAQRGEENTDFAGLLAMRLAYEVAVSESSDFHVNWASVAEAHDGHTQASAVTTDEELLRYALLKASEIAFRKQMVDLLMTNRNDVAHETVADRKLAQMVFCIDVRSERIRRQLETTSGEIETFGFAGFFGLPIEFVELGGKDSTSQVPVLISPQFKVQEEVAAADAEENVAAIELRSTLRFLRRTWKEFQSSAASCFAAVESTGLFYGLKLIARTIGLRKSSSSRFDGISKSDRQRLAPTFRGLSHQGITTSKQADLAESVLRGIGIVDDFARLVVFCGHGSQTENNPLQAGLDCGACGGHSGEANARFAALLLNQKYIRQALAERGIQIPENTHFVAALHNTTTDELEFFDTHEIPRSHHGNLQELQTLAIPASKRTRMERLSHLPGPNAEDLVRRSGDWSEVRPEWGLAGNAAFIAAPRKLTESISLSGRTFLHSYDYQKDPEFAVLEQIMTAPMVVANWINMQYYASTVDPTHFGSGNKTVHNVVGQFGILSGNGGDLMTGLPWQSVHDGTDYQHHPLRLLVVIAAPREAIEAVIAKHEAVANLLTNGWLQLVAIEDDGYFRYTEQQTWDELYSGALSACDC